MREIVLLLVHLLATLAKLLRSGGTRVVVAESLLLKHQLLIGNRTRQRAPNLQSLDHVVLGLMTLAKAQLRKSPKIAGFFAILPAGLRLTGDGADCLAVGAVRY